MPTIKGKWRWNDDVGSLSASDYYSQSVVNFSSNGEEFSRLRVEKYAIPSHVEIYYDSTMVQRCLMNDPYDENSDGDFEIDEFLNETYRIMDFGETEQEIDGELYAFIVANARPYGEVIADMLETIAVNEQRVFYAGRTEGYNHGYDDGSQDGYNQGHEDGKKSEYDTFWDTFQNYGDESGMSYNEVFGKGRFTDVNYNPKYSIQVAAGINSGYAMFNGANKITDIKVPIYHRGTNMGYLFNSCGRLKRIPALHILAEVTSFQSAFEGCNALEDITITGTIGQNINFKWSTKLTQTSITSIVNALSDDATGKTLTLSKAAVDEAFRYISGMYNEQGVFEEIINIKGSECWMWEELIATKSNWEFTLV